MQVIYYDNRSFLPTCVPIVNDWRDDVSSFRFTGPNWQVWIVPGTYPED